MPRMKVCKSHSWNEKTVRPDDEYQATEDEAKLVEALEWSKRLQAHPEVAKVLAVGAMISPRTGREKRQYRRRDMRSES